MMFSPIDKLLSKADQELIKQAIVMAEENTSGEIRVHFEPVLPPDDNDAYTHALHIFEKLEMHKTKERNAILFYVAVESKKYALVGDEGIHQKVTQQFWDGIAKQLHDDFVKGDFAKGLSEGIIHCGEQLKKYFPRQHDDKNELSNEISVGK